MQSNARISTEQRPPANDALAGGKNIAAGLVRSTALSAVRRPITTVRLGAAVLWQRPREVIAANLPVESLILPETDHVPGSIGFEKMLDAEGYPKAESGRLTWLVDGPEFFPELDRQIAEARESIDIQIFIFDNDDIAVKYADLLRERSRQVPVRVMFDDLGSAFAQMTPPETPAPAGFVPPADIGTYLKADSKVRVRRIPNPWLVCDHTKLLVFDKRAAILGGMNIGREYRSEWHDLMVKVEGPILASLKREFDRTWRKTGPWGDLALFRAPQRFRRPPPVTDGIPLRILRTDPAEGRRDILHATMMAIRASRTRVWVQNPYIAHDDIIRALEAAARRGVDVRVVIPSRGDSTIMDFGNLAAARRLIQAGALLYRYPKMTHMKVMLCDNWGCTGSANLDTLSMRINRELNLSFADGPAVEELERKVFLPDFKISSRMTLSDTDSLIAPLARILTDQL
jgi:cardiolipin synthase A/B